MDPGCRPCLAPRAPDACLLGGREGSPGSGAKRREGPSLGLTAWGGGGSPQACAAQGPQPAVPRAGLSVSGSRFLVTAERTHPQHGWGGRSQGAERLVTCRTEGRKPGNLENGGLFSLQRPQGGLGGGDTGWVRRPGVRPGGTRTCVPCSVDRGAGWRLAPPSARGPGCRTPHLSEPCSQART